MMTDTSTPPQAGHDDDAPAVTPEPLPRQLLRRITRLEIAVGAVIGAVMLALVVIEPDILEAPFENEQTLLFTVGGTAIAAIAFVAMLWLRVPAIIRVIVLVVPFAVVNWWLISPYFIDDVVDEQFSTSISEQLATTDEAPAAPAAQPASQGETEPEPAPGATDAPAADEPVAEQQPEPAAEQPADTEPATEAPAAEEPPPAPTGPVLLGAGQFVGLAGHDGTGDAGIFQNPDGSLVLRFENFDIENGPDLRVYLVPGADQTSLPEGSIGLGALEGNIGDQNYELPPGTELTPGAWTALVWCEAFSVEFVGATIVV
ncbi:DM13 domain-containing protein [Ilumatobacter sp.]|uniref:DM13 domain-containing protein n=1 Tax=Ilumatobacter sp. TaxID=1967498 RepID=UPI003AF8BE9F